ncbi:30S ribosomal protein S2 [Candidatus Micrarchaeota archaeon]|nr:30S ribosomal protein S2 [Candidatus Micrarchaeota archaeon]
MGELLIQQEKYLESGIHIGTKIKTFDMMSFIYKARQDKLYVLDLRKVDERIRYAAKFISHYNPKDVLIIGSRIYAHNPASKFAEIIGCSVLKGRFIPGILTNPAREDFQEPKLILVSDPKVERQAIREAASNGIPIIALCDTDNTTKFIDYIVPCNNKGKKSLALIFYLMAREIMKAQGRVSADSEFKYTSEDFESKEEATEEKESN